MKEMRKKVKEEKELLALSGGAADHGKSWCTAFGSPSAAEQGLR
jgi:hypothetical protein